MEAQNILIENREMITIGDVLDIGTFNEEVVNLTSSKGGIIVKGEELKILKLDLEDGKVVITGKINSLIYTEKSNKKEKSLMGRIFK